jgi:maltose alpha-D-glucosyltransferase / alpha-amylase
MARDIDPTTTVQAYVQSTGEAPVSSASVVQPKQVHAQDPLWYKDAVIYQVHVKSFFDANNDGIGDFAGLIGKLDYIASLGVTAVWLLPFYPSPRRDDGYDIADYKGVHPDYGSMADARRFIKEAHRRGLRVITELIVNHTSDQHPWFQRARAAKKGSSHRDFYVWADNDAGYEGTRIIFCDTEKSNWTWDPVAHAYFWHRFYSHQPDLNFDNPQVLRAVLAVMRYWLDLGVDGLRLDAVPYLIEREGTSNENLPETHAILKAIRAELDRDYPGRMLLAEANMWPEDVQQYFGGGSSAGAAAGAAPAGGEPGAQALGDECHMAFHFPLMPRMYMAIAQEDRFPMTDILRQTPDIPANCQWAVFLRNHDELTLEMVTDKERDYLWNHYATERRARINLGIRRRLAPLLERDRRRIELMNGLLLSMPGTPVIY